MRRLAVLAFLALASTAYGQEVFEDEATAALRAELLALRREVKELKARVTRLEAQLATLAPVHSEVTKAEVTTELGFVIPNGPRGEGQGAATPSELARFLHHAATTGTHELEALVAFRGLEFLVPENLWTPLAQGLGTVSGIPTKEELEIAFGALKAGGPTSSLVGMPPLADTAGRGHAIRILDLNVRASGRDQVYRLTAVRIGGRWFAAHLLALGVEDDARRFLADLVESQRSFWAFHKRWAKSLQELAASRKLLENHASLKAAGLSFPFARRLDALEREGMEWQGEELRSPFYRFRLNGDSGWNTDALPRLPSYAQFQVAAPPSASIGDAFIVKQVGGPSREAPGRQAERDP